MLSDLMIASPKRPSAAHSDHDAAHVFWRELQNKEHMSKRGPRSIRSVKELPPVKPLSRRALVSRWSPPRPSVWFLVLSAIWVLVLYARIVDAPFVYDDVLVIQNNPALSSWHDILRYFRSSVQLNAEYRGFAGSIYRPLTWLGFLINHKLSGNSPVGFHITNLLFHWANGVIGFFLLRKLGIAPIRAGATCLIWLALPINSEAVAWISGRHTCQATFFILLSLFAAVCYLREKRPVLLIGYLAGLLGAFFSNEWGTLALPLTGLFIYMERPKQQITWLNLCGGGAGITVLYLAIRHAAGAHLPFGPFKVLPVGLSFFKYLSWIILPVHMSVERSTDTPGNQITFASSAALAALLVFILLAFTIRKRAPRFAAGLAWILICILPFCGIVFIYQGMAERYTYLASAGFAFSLVALADVTEGIVRPIAFCILLLWVAWGGWRLNARLLDWGNQTTLFQSSLQTDPDSPVLLYNLGIASADSGDVQGAISYYRRALTIRPDYLNVLVNLGNLLREQGNYPAALALQKRALAAGPQSADLWVNLGDTYLKEGSADKAIKAFQNAISLDPNSLEANLDLGAAFQSMRQLSAARQQYEKAISIAPHEGAAYCNLGALLLKEGDVSGATEQFTRAIQQNASYYPAYFDLGLVYESTGRKQLAVSMFEKVLLLKPDHTGAALHLHRLQAR